MTARLIPLGEESRDDELTVYVKGFLGRGETPEDFAAWLASHRTLVERHGWSARASGYPWAAGRLPGAALPIAGGTKMAWDLYRVVRRARRINPLATAGWFLAEQATALSARFISQFIAARREAELRADELAECLEALTRKGQRVRVVAHSLGCRHVIEASARLSPRERPHEIHLCAPACLEGEVADKLAALARERTHVYYTGQDHVLEIGFRAVSQGRAIGAVGVAEAYSRLVAVDVSDAFDFWVHTEYKHRFGRFAAPRRGAPKDD